MDNDNKSVIVVAVMFLTLFITMIVASVYENDRTTTAITEAIKAGASPSEASCAFRGKS